MEGSIIPPVVVEVAALYSNITLLHIMRLKVAMALRGVAEVLVLVVETPLADLQALEMPVEREIQVLTGAVVAVVGLVRLAQIFLVILVALVALVALTLYKLTLHKLTLAAEVQAVLLLVALEVLAAEVLGLQQETLQQAQQILVVAVVVAVKRLQPHWVVRAVAAS